MNELWKLHNKRSRNANKICHLKGALTLTYNYRNSCSLRGLRYWHTYIYVCIQEERYKDLRVDKGECSTNMRSGCKIANEKSRKMEEISENIYQAMLESSQQDCIHVSLAFNQLSYTSKYFCINKSMTNFKHNIYTTTA